MGRFGTEIDGFSVAVDEGAGSVKVRMWGFWPIAVAGQFADAVAEACRSVRGPSSLSLDATELKPQRDDGVEAFRSLVKSLPKLGVTRTTIATSSPLTRLQLIRVAKDHAAPGAVEFTSQAAPAMNRSA